MLTGLVLLAASGAVFSGIPLVQDAAFAATAGLFGSKLFIVFVERRGKTLEEIHRRRLDALWVVVATMLTGIVYMLLR